MKLINTDGMAFIGPGSEWFWTAMSGIVLAVTFLAIYRQLRLQRSQRFEQIAAFTREWNWRMLVHRRNVLIALRDGTDRGPSRGCRIHGWQLLGGGRRPHSGRPPRPTAPVEPVRHDGPGVVGSTGSVRSAARDRDNDPTIYEDFEWLVGVLDEMDRGAGEAPALDLGNWRDRGIATIDGMLAVEGPSEASGSSHQRRPKG